MTEGNIATRQISKTGRGKERRIGKGKRSSAEDDKAAKKPRSKAANHIDSTSNHNLKILDGAYTYFESQRVGSKGIRQQMKKDPNADGNLIFSFNEFDTFYRKVQVHDPLNQQTQALSSSHINCLNDNSWVTLGGHNMLLYGIGCKKRLLRKLCERRLDGEDVIEVQGHMDNADSSTRLSSDHAIRMLLTTVASAVLNNSSIISDCVNLTTCAQLICDCLDIHYGRFNVNGKEAFTKDEGVSSVVIPKRSERSSLSDTMLMQQRWGGRYAHTQASLYIVVHDIGGELLNSVITQQCLALLAECKSVVFIATVDNVNALALWDRCALSKFRWTYHHVPTFAHHAISDGFPLIQTQEKPTEENETMKSAESSNNIGNDYGGNRSYQASGKRVDVVLQSLTANHKELMKTLCKLVVELSITNKLGNKGTSFMTAFKDLFMKLKSELVVKSDKELKSLLKEFVDHKLITNTVVKNIQYVVLNLPFEVIKTVAECY